MCFTDLCQFFYSFNIYHNFFYPVPLIFQQDLECTLTFLICILFFVCSLAFWLDWVNLVNGVLLLKWLFYIVSFSLFKLSNISLIKLFCHCFIPFIFFLVSFIILNIVNFWWLRYSICLYGQKTFLNEWMNEWWFGKEKL